LGGNRGLHVAKPCWYTVRFTTIDTGKPFDRYTQTTAPDPGRDGLTGTADDGTITVYNEMLPTQPSVLFTTNDQRVAQRYKGLEFTMTRRFTDGWTLLGGYTWSRTEVDATNVQDPNNAYVNASGRPGIDRAHNIKVTGAYTLPYDVQIGGNFRCFPANRSPAR
jgi:outer membrane receptor protein involved in Fe transport